MTRRSFVTTPRSRRPTSGAWLSDREGYGERVGLTLGLLLSAVGLLVVLVLPARPGSQWKIDGWRPRQRSLR